MSTTNIHRMTTEPNWDPECERMADRLVHSVLGGRGREETEYTFEIANRNRFLLLTRDCPAELSQASLEIQRQGMRLEYKIVYNTNQPYTIRVNRESDVVSIFQKYHP